MPFGTLSAMGYEKRQLMTHYSLFAVIPGILGGLLTSAAALLLAEPFGSLGLADYEPMTPDFTLPLWVAAAGVVIPTLIYFTAAMLRVRRLLREDTVRLLAGQGRLDAEDFPLLMHVDAILSEKAPVDIPWEKFTFVRE